MAGVSFEGITKRFGDVTAVDDLHLTIEDEEFMVLLGPSGCGKTTALRMVAGLESISGGTLRIGDRVVNDVEAKDRDISMVFQSYALYPHMTVARNIESPLLARKLAGDGDGDGRRKLTRAERDERVQEAARALGLEDLLARKPAALSGGQRQRVALARAIVNRPAVYLMDEPLSNLDAKLRAQTRIELVDLHRRVGTTFLYVTHDQVEAMTMASRIAVMHGGSLQQVGAPRDVYRRPQNLFVARFIGSPPMNTLDGTLATDGPATSVALAAGNVPLTGPSLPTAGATAGQAVVVGIRPEHLSLGPGPGGAEATLDASVHAVEWLGHERLVLCDTAAGRLIVREASATTEAAVGAAVRLAVDPGEVHLFDPATEERLS
jgi:multiple sugar transport system ATP-binding protein